mmetsp:Transcript_49217/g.98704  ORF Transcript_49217/g.98704 Transcript_49217/m.98704 type:complete len:85 (-) Transcript_49217:199-453(-)
MRVPSVTLLARPFVLIAGFEHCPNCKQATRDSSWLSMKAAAPATRKLRTKLGEGHGLTPGLTGSQTENYKALRSVTALQTDAIK